MADDRPSPIEISVAHTADGLRTLEEEWGRLHAEAPSASVFTSWEWQSAWWNHYGAGHSLRLLTAREGGRLIGVLPLYLRREPLRGGTSALVLRLVGTGGDTQPDDLGPILAGGREAELGRLLAEHVLGSLRDWDVWLVTDMYSDSVFTPTLVDAARRAGLAVKSGVSARISYTELPSSWEGFLATLSRSRRWRMRNTRRKVEKQAGVRFFVWEDGARLDEAVDRLAELHRLRWTAAGQEHGFSSPQYVGFHRQVVKSCFANGWLRLYCLEMAGELVAMYYCYRFGNRVFLMQGGFDPAHAELKPGHALLGFALEHAVREGTLAFDFLRGEHRYKEELATGARETDFVAAYRRTRGALAYRAFRAWLPATKRRVKAALVRAGLYHSGPAH